MAEGGIIPINIVKQLTNKNYYVWALKISAILRSRKLYKEVIEAAEPPISANLESPEAKVRATCEAKNDEAFSLIILTLSEEQAGQFLNESSAKAVWEKLKQRFSGNVEDRKIDVSIELKNIKMNSHESVQEYITRAKNIASRSAALGQIISDSELTFHVVRGIHPKMEKTASVLRTQRSLTIEEIEQALSEEEARSTSQSAPSPCTWKGEKAYHATEHQYLGCLWD
ncbi:PREDICTED: uncharacterized protein LOC107193730 [Dufourea novaeangliae]|uniref:uncharacterized protein LOC107193730 n=1 Tax=Dufourea novaeangliae TaxID=178035 RepID=UPI000767473A|nr:PREDICTED: uncharacterized protein LOC107193730 [Dufourea novaeangliae]